MNKFAIFAVLVVAAVALAQSAPTEEFPEEKDTRAALTVSDDVETADVNSKGMEVFADFCIQSRDFVYADVKSKAGSASSFGFSWFFSMSEDIAKEALAANKDATTRLSNQLAHPDAAVEGEDSVAAVQRRVSGQSQPMAFVTAFQGALATTAQAVVNVASQKFAAVKEFADPKYAVEFASSACNQVEEYEKQMRQQFEEYKEAMPAAAQKQYARTKFDAVPCVTSRRISRVNGVCRFISVSFEPIKKAIGY